MKKQTVPSIKVPAPPRKIASSKEGQLQHPTRSSSEELVDSEKLWEEIVTKWRAVLENETLSNAAKVEKCINLWKDAKSPKSCDFAATVSSSPMSLTTEQQIIKLFPEKDEGSIKLCQFFVKEMIDSESKDDLILIGKILKPFWVEILKKTSQTQIDDFHTMKDLYDVLTDFLRAIQNIESSFRKALLLFLADYVSERSNSFLFISPEHSALVDPSVHHVVGLSGTRIKNGISFLVIRKANRQVVLKAEVITY